MTDVAKVVFADTGTGIKNVFILTHACRVDHFDKLYSERDFFKLPFLSQIQTIYVEFYFKPAGGGAWGLHYNYLC